MRIPGVSKKEPKKWEENPEVSVIFGGKRAKCSKMEDMINCQILLRSKTR